MLNQNKFVVSHAPFWHNGSSVTERTYHTILAALPAVFFGIIQYGWPAISVVSLSVSTAILWELLLNRFTKRPATIGDGNAALLGLIFGMMIPAAAPWWAVLTGTFITVVIGKQIFGGIGGNVFHPVLVALAILKVSWGDFFDHDIALVNFDLNFAGIHPLSALKYYGVAAIDRFTIPGLLLGQQAGGIGATFGLGLLLGGIYLMLRGFIRWEIALTFLAGVFVTASIFNLADASRFAGPVFHIVTGYTLIGAFFLATEDSSSPVNFLPMLIYGFGGGIMTVLIRNIGVYPDGVIFAILVMNLVHPLLDKIRPKALGKEV